MDFNKIKEMGLEYAEKGKNAALDLAEKGKTQALIVNEQGKLLKAQRQLGALVYSLAKGKEENQPLVDKYIEMIDNIEQEIARLKASLTPAEAAEAEYVVHEEVPADQPEEHKACPQCGAPHRAPSCFCERKMQAKCGKFAHFVLQNCMRCDTIYSIFYKAGERCAGLAAKGTLYGRAAAGNSAYPAGPGERLSVG